MYIPEEERILEITKGKCPYNSTRKCDGLCNNCGLNVRHSNESSCVVAKSNQRRLGFKEIDFLESRCLADSVD